MKNLFSAPKDVNLFVIRPRRGVYTFLYLACFQLQSSLIIGVWHQKRVALIVTKHRVKAVPADPPFIQLDAAGGGGGELAFHRADEVNSLAPNEIIRRRALCARARAEQ